MVQSKRGIAVKEILFNNEINFKVVEVFCLVFSKSKIGIDRPRQLLKSPFSHHLFPL